MSEMIHLSFRSAQTRGPKCLDREKESKKSAHVFKRLFLGLLFVLCSGNSFAEDLTWFTDLPKAQATATAEKKSVLLFFHGSDWCPACIEMKKQVFDTPSFITYARQALVLVDVDFPQKSTQSEDLKRANLSLRAKFNVGENYPTLVLLNESGETAFQESGYAGGGPSEVLPNLQRHAKIPTSSMNADGYKDLSVAEFAQMAADKQNVILDVRTSKEFEAGHIAGAINIDVTSSDFKTKVADLDKRKSYLIHCASGVRSVRACKKLAKLEFPNLYNLPGGFHAWAKAGEPVEK